MHSRFILHENESDTHFHRSLIKQSLLSKFAITSQKKRTAMFSMLNLQPPFLPYFY